MTNYIDPEIAAQKFKKLKRYATVKDLKSVLNTKNTSEYDEDTLAIDVFDGPITSYTSLPYWLVAYLHHHRDKVVEAEEVYRAASRLKYRAKDVRATIKWLDDTQANFGHWREPKTKIEYLRWYDIDEPTDAGAVMRQTQACLDRGDDW